METDPQGARDVLDSLETVITTGVKAKFYLQTTGYSRLLAFYDDIDMPSTRHNTTDNNGHFSGHYYMGGVFTGIDIYLWKGLYCGAEVGMKAERMKESQSSYTDATPAHTFS